MCGHSECTYKTLAICVFIFSHNKKPHSHSQLVINLLKLFSTEQFVTNPELLVNKRIDHLFESDKGLQWYRGTVLEYLKDSQNCMTLKIQIISFLY